MENIEAERFCIRATLDELCNTVLDDKCRSYNARRPKFFLAFLDTASNEQDNVNFTSFYFESYASAISCNVYLRILLEAFEENYYSDWLRMRSLGKHQRYKERRSCAPRAA